MLLLCFKNSEHGNKMAKTGLKYMSGFTKLENNQFKIYMRDRLVRILHFPDTIKKSGKQVQFVDSFCYVFIYLLMLSWF